MGSPSGLYANIAAQFGQPAPYCFVDFFVSYCPSLGKRKRVLYCEVGSTGTIGGNIRWEPPVPQDQGILEGALVE